MKKTKKMAALWSAKKSWRFAIGSTAIFAAFSILSASGAIFAQDAKTEKIATLSVETVDENVVRIFVDGEFFADCRADYRGTPIVWPICAPNGALATRAWPMIDDVDVENEPNAAMKAIYQNAQISERGGAKDHPHHRSLWFNHGAVNGGDFWTLSESIIKPKAPATIECDGKTAKIQTKNVWFNDKTNSNVCEDVRTLTFGVLPGEKSVRYIDYEIEIAALENGVLFGDTKEGTFGVRLPSPAALTAKKSNSNWGGRILDSNGNEDGETWGKRASWVDYVGPAAKFLEGDELANELKKGKDAKDFPLTTVGIAVLDSPSSWAFPSWRHVRDYGLFATNPFGQKDFEPYNPDADGSKKLKRGEKLFFGYRVLIHDGDLTAAEIDAAFVDAFGKSAK